MQEFIIAGCLHLDRGKRKLPGLLIAAEISR